MRLASCKPPLANRHRVVDAQLSRERLSAVIAAIQSSPPLNLTAHRTVVCLWRGLGLQHGHVDDREAPGKTGGNLQPFRSVILITSCNACKSPSGLDCSVIAACAGLQSPPAVLRSPRWTGSLMCDHHHHHHHVAAISYKSWRPLPPYPPLLLFSSSASTQTSKTGLLFSSAPPFFAVLLQRAVLF